MKGGIKLLSLLALLLSMASCKGIRSHLAPGEYVRYMEDASHEFRRKVVTGTTEYVIQLATPEYMVSKELGETPDTAAFQKRMKELKGYVFFTIQMSKAGGVSSVMDGFAGARNAEQMVTYYDQAAQADINLKAGGADLRPVTYHFENNYGLVAYNTIVAGFEIGPEAGSNYELVFNDRYHDNPMIRAGFSNADLTHIPSLALK